MARMTLGSRIRELRKGRFSQRGLAERIGIDFTYLSKIENDADVPSGETLGRLADALEIDADELLSLAGKLPDELREHAAKDPRIARLIRRLPSLTPDDLNDVLDAAGVSDSSTAARHLPIPTMQADAPLDDEADDRLNRRTFAAAVADAIATRSDRSSIVVGIYGPWGDGKTTVLNWIRNRLDHPRSGIVVVTFNPWLIRDELTMLPAFFSTLATALGRRLGGRTDQIAGLLKRYGRVLAGINLGLPGASIDPGTTAAEVGAALADRTLDEMKTEFERILREEDRRVLVIIDDMDRLDDAEIHVVFKLVKLAAAFEGMTYLLAFDDDKVAAALAGRYSAGGRERLQSRGGYDFLEKIVQVPLRLPKARKEAVDAITLAGLQSALNDAGIEIDEAAGREFSIRYSQGLSPAITSLRTAKRYANAAGFALPLLEGEANPIDVLSVEGVNACYPALYATMREHPSWFLLPYEFHLSNRDDEIRSRQRERLETALATIEPGVRDAARELITRLFPQTERVWSNFGAADERTEWAEQQRVCSAEYFERYFSYSVPTDEVGDRELDDALEDPSHVPARVAALVERKGERGMEPLLVKLSRRAAALDATQAAAVIDAVVDLGLVVAPRSQPRFGALSLEERAASLFAELLMQVPIGSERNRVATRAVDRAEPMPFAAMMVHWSGVKRSRTDDQRALGETERDKLARRVAKRIVQHADDGDRPLWSEDRGLFLMFRARDGGEAGSMKAHVRSWLKRDPVLVTSLLWRAAGVAYGGDLGMAFQQDLTTDKYESLAEIADLSDVRTAVMAVRGDDAPPPDFPTVRYDSAARNQEDPLVLDQFVWQEEHARTETTGEGEPAASEHSAEAARARPTLHDEIAAVLTEAGAPLTATQIAERVRARGKYVPPRRSSPVDATQISARIRRPKYRDRFVRSGRRISLRNPSSEDVAQPA